MRFWVCRSNSNKHFLPTTDTIRTRRMSACNGQSLPLLVGTLLHASVCCQTPTVCRSASSFLCVAVYIMRSLIRLVCCIVDNQHKDQMFRKMLNNKILLSYNFTLSIGRLTSTSGKSSGRCAALSATPLMAIWVNRFMWTTILCSYLRYIYILYIYIVYLYVRDGVRFSWIWIKKCSKSWHYSQLIFALQHCTALVNGGISGSKFMADHSNKWHLYCGQPLGRRGEIVPASVGDYDYSLWYDIILYGDWVEVPDKLDLLDHLNRRNMNIYYIYICLVSYIVKCSKFVIVNKRDPTPSWHSEILHTVWALYSYISVG